MPQATFLGGYLFNWNFGYFSIGIDMPKPSPLVRFERPVLIDFEESHTSTSPTDGPAHKSGFTEGRNELSPWKSVFTPDIQPVPISVLKGEQVQASLRYDSLPLLFVGRIRLALISKDQSHLRSFTFRHAEKEACRRFLHRPQQAYCAALSEFLVIIVNTVKFRSKIGGIIPILSALTFTVGISRRRCC